MKLRHAVIHELIKESGQEIRANNLAEHLLDIHNTVVVDLIDKIRDLIGQRQNTANYGVFRQDAARTQFPDQVIAYCRSVAKTDNEFSELTKLCMEVLHEEASKQTLATGGYLVFADYENSGKRFFLTAMIKQRSGITMAGLVPESITELDLDKLHQVSSISFSKLQDYLTEKDEDRKQETTYVAFVNPSRSRETAGYFVTALGCEPGTPSTKATQSMIRGVIEFFDAHEAIRDHKEEVKLKLLDKLQETLSRNQRITLADIDTLTRPYFPREDEDEIEQWTNSLSVFLQAEPYRVPNEFPVSKSVVKRHTRFIYKSMHMKVELEKGVIGHSDGDPIFFDGRNNRLVISDTTFIDQLRTSLNGNE